MKYHLVMKFHFNPKNTYKGKIRHDERTQWKNLAHVITATLNFVTDCYCYRKQLRRPIVGQNNDWSNVSMMLKDPITFAQKNGLVLYSNCWSNFSIFDDYSRVCRHEFENIRNSLSNDVQWKRSQFVGTIDVFVSERTTCRKTK